MKALLKEGLVVLIPQSDADASALAAWRLAHEDHVLNVRTDRPGVNSLELHDMGRRLEACREPLNVVSSSSDPLARAISNLATSAFELDGRIYQSVESFWQSLKFEDEADRERLAALDGPHARQLGRSRDYGATVRYFGRHIPVGAWEHWRLMEQACRAKFQQREEARAALLATGERPLIHAVRRDSRTIPGVIMAQIWMRLRKELRRS
jgi:hypothetical protein